MSLQELLLAELVDGARQPTPAEVVAEVERQMSERRGAGYASRSSADEVRADRDAR